jgi:hypothetical protein
MCIQRFVEIDQLLKLDLKLIDSPSAFSPSRLSAKRSRRSSIISTKKILRELSFEEGHEYQRQCCIGIGQASFKL